MRTHSFTPLRSTPLTDRTTTGAKPSGSTPAFSGLKAGKGRFFEAAQPLRATAPSALTRASSTPHLDLAGLKALHDCPSAELVRSSPLALQAYAFDLSYPAPEAHARKRCKVILAKLARSAASDSTSPLPPVRACGVLNDCCQIIIAYNSGTRCSS